MIDGLGVDLVKIERIKEIINTWDKKFTTKIFTETEIAYCAKHKNSYLRYASTFAAKEAFIKAHGRGNLRFRDIEVVRENTGRPVINLHGNALKLIQHKYISRINVTITHDGDYAVAVVVLEK
ncbi:MAG: holo-[acyl-carrier-protein] synthase [Candidatus Dadabacteria bacterium]|nr:holo-[acyl-carrier-protein] synthase [Candidatus Dadabacteria bacterium]NIS07826.1 holo-[acyl-carrier-protein] synthase [Candidatus Dadabacteria bacterium]NIV42780.1 holo-[acyl-carrier-protein] synthase [Candidatus Dadabacteria bacterium]NIX14845.1 holo-[acyl-carrier-protein] synthase [Candidatus Dadabacteria bacterium]NIY21445.1 holo-[acyl-carrier-protein] synthase [Candidatus Dadabacteria bacterium]